MGLPLQVQQLMVDSAFYSGLALELIGILRRLSSFTKHPGAVGACHELRRSRLSYGGERLGQGHENVKQFLKEHVDMRTAIEERLRRDLGLVQEQEPQPV